MMHTSILEILNKFNVSYDEDIDLLLSDSAIALLKAGEFGKAYGLSKLMKGQYEKSDLLRHIADALVGSAEEIHTTQILDESKQAALKSREIWQQAELLCMIGQSYLKLNRIPEFNVIMLEAIKIAKEGEKSQDTQLSTDCSGILQKIAELTTLSGNKEEALKIALSIENEYKRGNAIKKIESSNLEYD